MPHSTSPSFDVPQSTTTPAVPLSEGSVHTSRDPMQPSSNTDSRGPAALPPEALAFAGRMFDAARNGDLAVFQQAVPAGLPVNLTNEKGDTLLMLSSYHGHAPLTTYLLSQGADPNALNDRQQSPLAGAVFKNEDAVVRALLEGGADPDLGQPSAAEAVTMFRMEGVWEAEFEKVREKLGTVGG